MLKAFAAVVSVYLVCSLLVDAASLVEKSESNSESTESAEVVANATALRQKRGAYGYLPAYHSGSHEHFGYHHGHHHDGYPFNYYHWYHLHPTVFTPAHCPAQYACPAECPGTCGTWGDLYACRCHGGCPLIGDPCNHHNIAHGNYLHVYPHDATKYVQCDTTPGIVYIRSCPAHLVFDPRFSVCNYADSVYHHHHHGHHHHGHHGHHGHYGYHYGK